MRVKIPFLIFTVFAAFFSFAYAAQAQGLVPCGGPGNPCTTCDLIVMANKVIDFLFTLVIAPLAALGILASGIVILTAGGSESQIGLGKKMLWNILIGFIIAASAWVIVNTILGNLVISGYNYLTEPFPACT